MVKHFFLYSPLTEPLNRHVIADDSHDIRDAIAAAERLGGGRIEWGRECPPEQIEGHVMPPAVFDIRAEAQK